MNQQTKALIRLVIAAMIMFLISIAVYFIGGELAKMFILTNAAEAGIENIPTLFDWKNDYYYLVQDMGAVAGVILLLWTALTHWALRTSSSTGVGKRWLWALLGIILAVLCLVIPNIFEKYFHLLIIDMSIPLLFLTCYGIVGYWGGSIFVTSDRYKYTPIFSRFFRS